MADKPEQEYFAFRKPPALDGKRKRVITPEQRAIGVKLLEMIGEDPNRGGLMETPERFIRALFDYTEGMELDPHEVLKMFEDGAGGYDEMVFEGGIRIESLCEHHLAPFFGTACVAYVPGKRIVGLSKMTRLANIFSRRLQVQERLTTQIADFMMNGLEARGVAVVIRCRHLCKEYRGVRAHGSHSITSALRGVFVKPEVRAEFMGFVQACGFGEKD